MTRSEKSTACMWTQERIEAYIDGDLPGEEAARLDEHLQGCTVCSTELALASELRQTLNTLPQQSCPDRVSDAVMDQVHADLRAERWRRVRDGLAGWLHPAWRPAMATAVLAVLLVAALFLSRPEQPASRFSAEEVAAAEVEAKWALAYIGEIGRRTGYLVRDQVIEAQVVVPARRAVDTIREAESLHSRRKFE